MLKIVSKTKYTLLERRSMSFKLHSASPMSPKCRFIKYLTDVSALYENVDGIDHQLLDFQLQN